MTKNLMLIALVAAAALAGCKKENHTIVAGPDTNDATPAATTPVALPPSITASKIYRCTDNLVVYVDWLSDGKSAAIRTGKSTAQTRLAATEAGKPMTAQGGYSLTGSATESSVKVAVPGHSSQPCKA